MKKKILSIIMIFFMVLGLIPNQIFNSYAQKKEYKILTGSIDGWGINQDKKTATAGEEVTLELFDSLGDDDYREIEKVVITKYAPPDNSEEIQSTLEGKVVKFIMPEHDVYIKEIKAPYFIVDKFEIIDTTGLRKTYTRKDQLKWYFTKPVAKVTFKNGKTLTNRIEEISPRSIYTEPNKERNLKETDDKIVFKDRNNNDKVLLEFPIKIKPSSDALRFHINGGKAVTTRVIINGQGGVEYYKNTTIEDFVEETVTIIADDKDGEIFDKWTTDNRDIYIKDPNSNNTTFEVRGNQKESNITANYVKSHNIKVKNVDGINVKVDKEKAKKGDRVKITYQILDTKKHTLDKFLVNGRDIVTPENIFVMLDEDVEITAILKDILQKQNYKLKVTNGQIKDKNATTVDIQEGSKVTIVADVKTGKTFKEWEVKSRNVALSEDDKKKSEIEITMPQSNVDIEAMYTDNPKPPVPPQKQNYKLTVKNGKIKDKNTTTADIQEGSKVTIVADVKTGKTFKGWKLTKGNSPLSAENKKKAEIEITMPASDVEIEAEYMDNTSSNTIGGGGGGGGGAPAPTKRDITTPSNLKNGKISIDKTKAKSGEKVTITVNADKGYKVKSLKVKDKNGKEISTTINKDKTYSFDMPISEVKIDVEFEKEEPKKEDKKSEPKYKVKLKIGSEKMTKTLDGKTEQIQSDVAPFIKDGRTMLPVRYAAQALGIDVEWDRQTRTVIMTDGKKKILIPIDTNKIIVDGKEYISDVKPIIEKSRTYLSISNLSKALGLEEGKDIIWNQETKEVTISKPDTI